MDTVGGDLRLRPVRAGTDVVALANELADGFGDDRNEARNVLEQTLALLTRDPRPDPWGCYLAERGGSVVGTCAFKAAPDGDNVVELAYMTFPAFEGRGHAGAMAAALVDIAAAAGAALAIAHTLPEENASTRVLRRNAFRFAGEAMDPEDGLVWRWERRLADGSREGLPIR